MYTAPGKTLIQVSGIIQIVYASFSLLFGLFVSLVGGVVAGFGATQGTDQTKFVVFAGILVLVLAAILLLLSGINLAFGILGVKHCNRPEKAKLIRNLGITIIVLQILAVSLQIGINWFSNTYGAPTPIVDASTFSGMIVPVALAALYIVGANKNLQDLPTA